MSIDIDILKFVIIVYNCSKIFMYKYFIREGGTVSDIDKRIQECHCFYHTRVVCVGGCVGGPPTSPTETASTW